MVKVLIINELNHKINIEKLIVYAKETDKHPKARIVHYELDGYDYDDIDIAQFNKMKQFFREVA